MELTKCPLCNQNPIVGKQENHYGMCSLCIELKVKRMHETEVKVHDLEVENDQLRKAMESSIEKVQKFQSLMKAEMEGVSAADRALDEDQNPYPDGELCVMWLNGHQSVETRRRTAQAIAVMRWADSSLLTIQELARGYGQHEIADKIGTIVEKLEPFQGG